MPITESPKILQGSQAHGFSVVSSTPLPDLAMHAIELAHDATGARVLHFACEDLENLFSINFPTPPADDTGLPHIMEHSVLSGSRRFPVRDPFFEMLKMSMATFINAMTGMDCTYYPVCSNVRRDLFNLADVYFDAVFHPLLSRETFLREGCHPRPVDDKPLRGDLEWNGIVYNEMKAAYSRPDDRLGRAVFRHLFPDTCYGRDAGGNPEAIPDLTYDAFLAFHRHRYHPSNARLVLYGNIPTVDFLEFLAPRLAGFDRQESAVAMGRQPRWSRPREYTESYDIGDESPLENTYLQMNWAVPGGLDAPGTVWMRILGLVLLGDDAAPLKKAIIDAKLGHDVIHSGYSPVGLEGLFCVGIRGSEPERMEALRSLVLRELADLCDRGITEKLVESAFRRVRYEVCEIGPMRPLQVAHDALSSWVLGGDPLLFLRLGETLEACRRKIARHPEILTELIRDHLLNNPHRLDLTLVPDAEWRSRQELAFRARLKTFRQSIGDAQLSAIAREAAELDKRVGIPNSPKAVASLPQLTRADLPDDPAEIPVTVETLATGGEFLRNDVFSNGVNYLRIFVDLEGLPDPLWDMVPYYLDTLNKLGAAGKNYAKTAQRVSAATGGFWGTTLFREDQRDASVTRKGVLIGIKALDDQIEDALDLLHDKLFAMDPRDRDRFRDVMVQRKAWMRSRLLDGGPSTGLARLMAGMTEAGFLQDRVGGASCFRTVRRRVEHFDDEFETMIDGIERIDALVRNRNRVTFGFTGSDAVAERVRRRATSWLRDLSPADVAPDPSAFTPFPDVPRMGLAAPMQVAHCTQAIPAPGLNHPDAPLLHLAMALLRVDYMVNELRFKGNAYGASCAFPGNVITLSTYADPHICRTLDVFAGLPAYVRDVGWTDVELTRAIVSTAKNYMKPIRPEEATQTTLLRHLAGESDAMRSGQYHAMLSATPDRVKSALLSVLDEGLTKAPVVVVASRERLETANRQLAPRGLAIQDLLA